MTEIGLVADRIRWDEKMLIRSAENLGIDLKLIDPKTIFIDVLNSRKNLRARFGDVVIQRCVSYFRGLHVTSILDTYELQVINPFNVSLICGNKLFTTLILGKANIPVPKTLVAFTQEGVSKALENLGYPAVLKPVVGSWGRLIALLKDKDTAQAVVESREHMNNALLQTYYIQEYVKRPPRDIRVLVIGNETVAASYRYSQKTDWRTNVARGGTTEPCPINDDLAEIAIKATETVGGGVLAVDCMESQNGIVVNEINSTVEFRGLYSATKIDIPSKIIEYAVEVIKK